MRFRGATRIAVIPALLCCAFSAHAVSSQDDIHSLKAELKRLADRIEQLERRNTQLEQAQTQQARSLEEPVISENESALTARLKAVESQTSSHQKAATMIEALEGIKVDASLTMVAQGIDPKQTTSAKQELNFRGDVGVTVPMGTLGNSSESLLYGQFRMGQGRGLQTPGTAFSSPNATTFQRPGEESSDSTVLLAQAWYQLSVPLPLGGNPDLSRQHIELNFGKMDPFGFFDQNAIADDETHGFINQAFVHNPQLDVGGDIGVDEFGFSPGLRVAYVNERQRPENYALSIGVFGADKGASFEDSLSSPIVIVQAETERPVFEGLIGHYRVYAWRNGRGRELDDQIKAHSGVGVSIDQRVHDYLTLFARYGHQLSGNVRFDRSLTVGTELGGSYWNRGADAIGIAVGWLKVSDEFGDVSETLDADGDGVADFAYRARGSENIVEMYYRYFLNAQFHITPSLQFIHHPGGNRDAEHLSIFGIRAQLDY